MNKSLIGIGVVILGIFGLGLIGVMWYISTGNKLVRLDEQTREAWSQVENQYQRRMDLIPNLVATVQGAATFEKSTLEAVVQARASVGRAQVNPTTAPTDPAQLAQYEQAQAGLGNALSRLLVVMERYPELKANQNFLELQSQLEGTENRIAVERKRYNDAARDYNVAIRQFPGSVVASMSGFKPKAYFAVTNPAANQAPTVDFGTTLVLVLDLRPLLVGLLPERDEAVVGSGERDPHHENQDDENHDTAQTDLSHLLLLAEEGAILSPCHPERRERSTPGRLKSGHNAALMPPDSSSLRSSE